MFRLATTFLNRVGYPRPRARTPPSSAIASTQLGVWRVLTQTSSESIGTEKLRLWVEGLPILYSYLLEIYSISPALFLCVLAAKAWHGIQPVLLMYLSSTLFAEIELGFTQHPNTNTRAILTAVVARVACATLSAAVVWWAEKLTARLKTRVLWHFRAVLLQAELRLDMPTSQDKNSDGQVTADKAWEVFNGILDFSKLFLEIITGVLFVSSRDNGGPLFAALCVAKPILEAVFRRTMWMKPHVTHSNNPDYDRCEALKSMGHKSHRESVILDNLGEYIMNEFMTARRRVGEIPDDHHEFQYRRRSYPWFDMFAEFTGNLPIIYIVACALLWPSKFSLSSIATLQAFQTSMRYNISVILIDSIQLGNFLTSIKEFRKRPVYPNQLLDGIFPYPNAKQPDTPSRRGMSFEVKNVRFTYPGSKSTKGALNGVSFSINPGQIIVIVGPNGSGKSTILKLLTRLYDAESGSILIDGRPIGDYELATLRQATAVSSQEHSLYPLSLRENITLGLLPDESGTLASDPVLLRNATKRGGADECVGKLVDGLDTVLDPPNTAWGYQLGDTHQLLKGELERLEKPAKLSGGEKQRIAAARLFMRLNSKKIKFVAIDEPSAALDAEGEQELFEQFRAARDGKTIVIVSHRFGHLTRFADNIICMGADGTVAESGTHEQLLRLDGEYSKLYNIQAQGFTTRITP